MDTFIRINTILLPSNSSSAAARYALRATTMKFRSEFLGSNLSLKEFGLLEESMDLGGLRTPLSKNKNLCTT